MVKIAPDKSLPQTRGQRLTLTSGQRFRQFQRCDLRKKNPAGTTVQRGGFFSFGGKHAGHDAGMLPPKGKEPAPLNCCASGFSCGDHIVGIGGTADRL